MHKKKPLFDALTIADGWGPRATSLSFESFLHSKANPPEMFCKVLQFPCETYNEDFVAFSQLHTPHPKYPLTLAAEWPAAPSICPNIDLVEFRSL